MGQLKFGQANVAASVSNGMVVAPPYVIFKNSSDQRNIVYIGASNVGPTTGYVLSPGESLRLDFSEDQTFYWVAEGPSGAVLILIWFEPET